MGIRGMSIGSIVIVLLIVFLIFGTKRLRNIGTDLGAALKGFRKGVKEADGSDEHPKKTNNKTNS